TFRNDKKFGKIILSSSNKGQRACESQCECEFVCERLGKPLARVFGALQVTRSQHFTPTLKRTLKTQGIPHKSMRV
ncbi:MAG: hypothetical protein ACK5PO_10255, partial [Bacteroidota bacterium]